MQTDSSWTLIVIGWKSGQSNHLFPSMGPNGGSVAMDSVEMCVVKYSKYYSKYKVELPVWYQLLPFLASFSTKFCQVSKVHK